MTNREESAKHMLALKTKKPEYKRLDIEPKTAGTPLIKEEFARKATPVKSKVPPLKEISNEALFVKANNISLKESDDGFIPPKSNFVSVGNLDHTWYGPEVTGIVDNNDRVDIEKLQGMNPLADAYDEEASKTVSYFTERLTHLKNLVASELLEITNLDELNNLKQNAFGKNGLFSNIVKKLQIVKPSEKSIIGDLINNIYSEIDLDIQGKEFELTEEEKEDETDEWPEDMAQIINSSDNEEDDQSSHIKEDYSDITDGETEDSPEMPEIEEGCYAVVIDGELVKNSENINDVRDFISNILLNENVDFNRIQLFKRIKIDFGLIIEE